MAEKVLECGRNGPAKKVFPPKNGIKLQGEENITSKSTGLEGNVTRTKFWTRRREFFHNALKAFSVTEADGNLDEFNSQSSTLASHIPVQALEINVKEVLTYPLSDRKWLTG